MAALSSFIGRDAELARLTALLAERRLVTVVGPGGMGKTRLADECLTRAAATWTDGVHRCELAALSAREDVGAEAAGQLGFPSLESLLVGIGDGHALVLLDNCEHLLPAARRLAHQLLTRCPRLRVLATSREALGVDGEQVLVLAPLGLPTAHADPDQAATAPAVLLFADRARATGAERARSASDVAAMAELCRRLDGVPLAIELAASRSRTLGPAELLGLLDRRFELLRRAEPLGGARHGSLRAAIDTSYALLSPEEAACFRALGVFAGPFDAALAHAVADADGDALRTLDLLARLVDRSLVVADEHPDATRYRLLDSLRHYAADAARAEGAWPALEDRFVAAMLAQADRVTTEAVRAWSVRVFTPGLAQFRTFAAAIEACLTRDADAARAFRLLMPLWAAIHQGRAAETAALCDRIRARWPAGAEPLRPEADMVAATAYLVDGRRDEAAALAAATLEGGAPSPLATVIAWRVRGLLLRTHDDVAAADAFRRGADVADAAGLVPFARELRTFGATLTPPGALDAALARLRETAAAARDDDDPIGEVWAHLVAAHLCTAADRRAEARATLSAADAVLARFDYPFGRNAAARMHVVLATLDEGWGAARAGWADVVARMVAGGDLGELASTLRTAAALARRAGDAATAEALLDAVPAGASFSPLGTLFQAELPPEHGGAPAAARAALGRVRALLAGASAEATAESAAPATPDAALVRDGAGWTITFAGRTVRAAHRKGFEDLVVLLSRPEQEVHCIELAGGTDAGGSALPGLDERARREYRTRMRDLQEAIDDARARNDPGPAERAEAELEALTAELTAAFGLGGRTRARGSAAERARTTVAWRIRAAIRQAAALHPELGRHLENAVRTGVFCVYRPETPVTWRTRADVPSS